MAKSVLIVNDRPVLRHALKLLLESSSGIDVFGATGDRETALEIVADKNPDVALVDLDLVTQKAEVVVSDLLSVDDEIGVLIFCDKTVPAQLKRCIDSGARGCISKDGSLEQLHVAITDVANGCSCHDPKLEKVVEDSGLTDRKRTLSTREAEVLTLLSKGYSGVGAAKQLWISPETVRTHVRNAMSKLGAKTRTHAVVLAMLHGQIEGDDFQ